MQNNAAVIPVNDYIKNDERSQINNLICRIEQQTKYKQEEEGKIKIKQNLIFKKNRKTKSCFFKSSTKLTKFYLI